MLWPSRIRFHFWSLAFLLALIVAISSPNGYGVIAALSIIPVLTWIIPSITYSFCNVAVLDEVLKRWPRFLDTWFQGMVHLGPYSRRTRKRDIVYAYLPPVVQRSDAVYWSPYGSSQETMLRAAIQHAYQNAMYQDIGAEPPPVWLEQAFIRFMVYWCCPIWATYLVLWLVLLPGVFCGVGCLPSSQLGMHLATILWMVYGALYMLRESEELSGWVKLDDKDLRFVPLPMQRLIGQLHVAGQLKENYVQAVLAVVNFFGTVVYLSFLDTLYP